MNSEFTKVLGLAVAQAKLTAAQVVTLLQADQTEYQQLVEAADQARRQNVGDSVWLRGLIEFSSICREHCLYCGLRAENQQADRYRMSEAEIMAAVKLVADRGLGTVVLQSGEDPGWTARELCQLVWQVKQQFPTLMVTLSIGERPRVEYQALRAIGVDRFLMRFETSNPALFAEMHPGSGLAGRLECLHWLRELGFEVGSGSLVGLPGQTVTDLANDLLLMQELQLDMIGIGPFIPHPETPLADAAVGTAEMTLRMMAVARLLCPKANLPVTTALAALDPLGREKGWLAGGNVVMPNATPVPYKAQYELYPDKPCLGDELTNCLDCLAGRIRSVGRTIGYGPGRSLAWEERQHADYPAQ